MTNAATSRATDSNSKRQAPLREADVKNFLAKYKEAWETQNADLAASLFTRDVHYRQDPFSDPIIGREAIHAYWAEATGKQEAIHFTFGNLIRSGYLLAAEWTCRFQDRASGEKRELAGMFFADFYGKQVRRFREYWHSRRR
jgi:SnoaL-like domain